MRIRDVFETKVEEKIEPVIKVGDCRDERKLAGEIGSYVVTPTIETHLDDFLEHYTDTFRQQTEEMGVWISGYFGSGKSHLAKIAALLCENRTLDGILAAKRFESRIPADAPHRTSILRSLSRLGQCDTRVLAFNLNTLSDSKTTPLPRLLLTEFYQSKGYGANFLYARVIEAELDKLGKLDDLHAAAERLARKPWADIQRNPGFYARPLYQAASEVASSVFSKPEDVAKALENAKNGELYNVQFLVRTILDDLDARQEQTSKPCRLVLVLDESGQWIEDDAGRLAQLQAFVEEAAAVGQGKIWVFVTTHEDMGSIYQNARALKGDMKKIEGRFRFRVKLTTENIELVLQDRIFRKNLPGKNEVVSVYQANPGVLRDLGQLANTSQKLPDCTEDRFAIFYPFFPYQIHLIPEIVKSLRSAGGRGEQLSGSTRTLLAITQDILRAGRRKYLDAAVGEIVSFDELYHNLSGEGEVANEARRELSRIEEIVPGGTLLTRRVAEVLYLIREIAYIPRTIDNIARLLVEHTIDDLASVRGRVEPELNRLITAKLVARIGEEYEFLTGERRTFEEEVAGESAGLKWQDLAGGLTDFVNVDVLGFQNVPFKGAEFPVRISVDGSIVTKDGDIEVRVSSVLAALGGTKVSDLEDISLRPDEQQNVFVLSDRITGFEQNLKYYLAMRAVVDRWKGDPHKSAEAHQLAATRESSDLEKLRMKVRDDLRDGLRQAHIVFRGASHAVTPKPHLTPGEALRNDLAALWPTLYPKYDKVPVRIANEQRAILEVLRGAKDLPLDVRNLKLLDKAGQLDPQCPLLDAIRVYLSARQTRNERTLGKDLLHEFTRPPYGWDPAAVRVGLAALTRAGVLRVLINKKPFTNPADPQLQDSLRVSRQFDKVELVLEDTQVDPDELTAVRSLLIKLTGKRKIDETPAALAAEMETFATDLLGQARRAQLWAQPAGLLLPPDFIEGADAMEKILALTNPVHRVGEIHSRKDTLESLVAAIRSVGSFVEKRGQGFTSMRSFAEGVGSVEHLLPDGGGCRSFLRNWNTALASGCIMAEDTWKDLQNSKATAELELTRQLTQWREDARRVAQDAIAGLPQALAAAALPAAEVQETLATPLNTFIASIDQESQPARVAALPQRAERLRRELAILIEQERTKRTAKGKGEKPKPVKRIRMAEIASTVPIQNEQQWADVRDRLDQSVRKELADGNQVELS